MSDPLEKIAEVLEFTLDELAMNRAGQISSHQLWGIVKSAVVQGGIALLYLSGVVAMLSGALDLHGFRRVAFYTLGLGGLVLMIPVAFRNVAAAVTRRVVVHEGQIDLHGTGRVIVAIVGANRLPISTDALKVLTSGERYRIYSLAYSDEFLSIEPASPAPASGEEAR